MLVEGKGVGEAGCVENRTTGLGSTDGLAVAVAVGGKSVRLGRGVMEGTGEFVSEAVGVGDTWVGLGRAVEVVSGWQAEVIIINIPTAQNCHLC